MFDVGEIGHLAGGPGTQNSVVGNARVVSIMVVLVVLPIESHVMRSVAPAGGVVIESSPIRIAAVHPMSESKRPGKPFLPGSVVLGPVNSGLWAFSGEVRDERTGAGLA